MYQNYPDPAAGAVEVAVEGVVDEVTTQENEQKSAEEDEDDSLAVNRQYNFPPVPIPVRVPTEKTQLLLTGQSNGGENSPEHTASTSSTLDKGGRNKRGGDTGEFSMELSHLAIMSHVFIKEQIELSNSVLGLGLKKILKVTDTLGHRLLSAHLDKNGCCMAAPLDIVIKDRHEQPIIHLTLNSTPTCCFPTCGLCCRPMSVEVTWVGGKPIGRIEEVSSFWSVWGSSRKIRLLNSSNELLFTVLGPNASCFQKGEFKIVAQAEDGKVIELGKICNKWTTEEGGKSKDMLGVSFPKELDNVNKTMLIIMCMLFDLTYFSSS